MNVNLGPVAGLAFDPSTGFAYVVDGGDSGSPGTNVLHSLNTSTGHLTAIGPLGLTNGLAGLAFVPSIPEPTTGLVGVALAGVCIGGRLRRDS